MRFIGRGATNQPQLPTLELREQEIIDMYQSKPRRSRCLTVSPVRKPFASKILNPQSFAQLKRPLT